MTDRKYIGLFGTVSIQSYVFGSNRLKENAGASYLAACALDHWSRHPGKIYVGGGNAAVEFDCDPGDEIFEWSRTWLQNAPGLRVTAACVPITGSLQDAYRQAQRQLAESENAAFGAELEALPVVRTCPSTGGPAGLREGSEWLSYEAKRKRDGFERAEARLATDFSLPDNYRFPRDLSDLGTREGASQVAIVHADGNGIGKELKRIVDRKYEGGDEAFRTALSAFSVDLTATARTAFRKTLNTLPIAQLYEDNEIGLAWEVEGENKKLFFPVRPIVYGGDDLTFICHGRLGLALAWRYLSEFAQASKSKFTACAGVVIMPGKFPFARGYELATELCLNAKKKRGTRGGSWLDFHILKEGSEGSLKHARASFQADVGRPYKIGGTWDEFETAWTGFRSDAWARNRAKHLYEGWSRSPDDGEAIVNFLQGRGVALPLREESKRPICFDALDALDFHIRPKWTAEEVGHAAEAAN